MTFFSYLTGLPYIIKSYISLQNKAYLGSKENVGLRQVYCMLRGIFHHLNSFI